MVAGLVRGCFYEHWLQQLEVLGGWMMATEGGGGAGAGGGEEGVIRKEY